MIRAGGITRRRADTAIFLLDELLVGQCFARRVTPQFTPHTLVKVLGAGFRETISERLEHDARVVVMRALEAGDVLLDADSRRHGERPEVVAHPAGLGRDVVGEALVRLPGSLALLLAQERDC